MVLEADFYLSAWVSRELITSRGYRRWGGASRNKNPLKQLKNTFVAGDLFEKEPANDGRFEKWFLQVKPPREHFIGFLIENPFGGQSKHIFVGKNLPILGHAYEGNIFRTMFQRLKNLRCQNPKKHSMHAVKMQVLRTFAPLLR